MMAKFCTFGGTSIYAPGCYERFWKIIYFFCFAPDIFGTFLWLFCAEKERLQVPELE